MKRTLSIDYGTARVGLAISDPLGITAQPLAHLKRRSDLQICLEIADIVSEREVGSVILGHPLEMSGKRGKSALMVEKFVALLEQHIDVDITLWDERLTTVQAERAMDEEGLHWRKRKSVVDQLAATVLLQSWLEHDPVPFSD